MGQIIFPNQTEEKVLGLGTRKGREIDNCQYFKISFLDEEQLIKRRLADLEKEFPNVELCGDMSPIYNCHGLTFACKRTGIYEAEEVQKILDDDEYREVELKDVMPGDTIVYYTDDGDVDHSGFVVAEREANPKLLSNPRIYSKWGKEFPVVHSAMDCPYAKNVKYYRIVR